MKAFIQEYFEPLFLLVLFLLILLFAAWLINAENTASKPPTPIYVILLTPTPESTK